jgi:hypothetical protein
MGIVKDLEQTEGMVQLHSPEDLISEIVDAMQISNVTIRLKSTTWFGCKDELIPITKPVCFTEVHPSQAKDGGCHV